MSDRQIMKEEKKTYLKFGLIFLFLGVLLLVIYNHINIGNTNPKLTVTKYISLLKKGDLNNIKKMAPSGLVEDKISQLGNSFYQYIKNINEIYYKNGFEVWANNFESIWEKGNTILYNKDIERNVNNIAKYGFEALPNHKKINAGNYKLYILRDEELISTNKSRKNLFDEYLKIYFRNKLDFFDIIGKLSKDKRDYILNQSKITTPEKYKKIIKKYNLKYVQKNIFITTHGKRILKEKLIEKYDNFEIKSLLRVNSKNEFEKKPFKGKLTYILLNSDNFSDELVFKLKKNGITWNLVSVPGNKL